MPLNYIALYDTGEPLPFFIGTISSDKPSEAACEQDAKDRAFHTLIEKLGAVDADAWENIRLVPMFDRDVHIS